MAPRNSWGLGPQLLHRGDLEQALQVLDGLFGSSLLVGEWGAVAFGQKIAATIGSRDLDPQTAVQQLQQATVAQREVLRVLLWPEERIKALKAAKLEGMPMQRGGY